MNPASPAVRASPTSGKASNSALLAAVVVAAIGVLSFLPIGDKRVLHTKGRFHLWGHLVVFTIAAFVLLNAGRSRQARLLLFFGTLLLGVSIEFGQHLVYRMPVETADMLVDAIGVVLGSLLVLLAKGRSTPEEFAQPRD